MKNNNKILWLIAGIAIFLIISKTTDNIIPDALNPFGPASNTGTDRKTDMLSVECYDRNMNPVNCNTGARFDINLDSPFSIVNNVPGIYFIRLTTAITSRSSSILSCNLNTLSPPAFDSAVIKTTKSLPPSGQVAWTSAPIDVTQFEELQQPTIFITNATCSSASDSQTRIGSLSMTILPEEEGGAGFDINISEGGIPDEYCGDGICQTNEDQTSCPQDCLVFSIVKFRTTDLGYISGSAVGYTTSCGSNLTGYGYYSATGQLTGTCAVSSKTWCGSSPTLALNNLPGGWLSGGANPSLWTTSQATPTVCVCDDNSAGNYQLRKFTTTDSDAGDVSTDPISIDTAMEVLC